MMSRLPKAMILGLIIGIVGLGIGLTPFGLDLEENIGLDLLFTLRGARQPPSDVVIVSIDQKSAEHLNVSQAPRKWPRSLHARLTENLVKQGARVIAFDLIFDEMKSPEEDNLFAETISKARNVILCESLKSEKVPLTTQGGPPKGNINIEKLLPPIPPFAQASVATAPFPLPKVPFKVSQYWRFKTEAGDTPTLPVVVFQLFGIEVYEELIKLLEKATGTHAEKLPHNKEAIITNPSLENLIREIRDIFENEPQVAEKMRKELQKGRNLLSDPKKIQILGSLIKMYHGSNTSYLNFYGPPGTVTTVPYYRVLQSQGKEDSGQKPFDFNGKAVFVGLSERFPSDQKDGFPTVFSESTGLDISGVEIAATAFANLLEDKPVQPLSFWAHVGLILLWGVVVGMICYLFPTFFASMSLLGLMLLYFILAVYQFKTPGQWYTFIVPLLIQAPLAFISSVVWKEIEVNKERKNIRKALGYYLPDKVVNQLARNVEELKASKQMVYGICLYTDAEQYTRVSEPLNPMELHQLMNKYYGVLFKPIKQHGGVVSGIVGDSMLAIWVTQQPDSALRDRACQAALDIAKGVDQFNQSQPSDQWRLPTRIGLHTGDIFLGAIGAIDHYEYTPLGDIVNTAQRIENLNKSLGTRILASGEMIDQLDGFLVRELGKFQLKGKINPVSVYELICRIEESNEEQRIKSVSFPKVLDPFRKGYWQEAEEAIETYQESIESLGKDGPSHFFLNLCKKYGKNPPGESWSGVVSMEEK
ncbi:MAG: CHASE2 domain-containing protein [Thermodesulfobacteriota bacterium]